MNKTAKVTVVVEREHPATWLDDVFPKRYFRNFEVVRDPLRRIARIFQIENHHHQIHNAQGPEVATETFYGVVRLADANRRGAITVLMKFRAPAMDVAVVTESQIERAGNVGNRDLPVDELQVREARRLWAVHRRTTIGDLNQPSHLTLFHPYPNPSDFLERFAKCDNVFAEIGHRGWERSGIVVATELEPPMDEADRIAVEFTEPLSVHASRNQGNRFCHVSANMLLA
jgi:hypothetical protein